MTGPKVDNLWLQDLLERRGGEVRLYEGGQLVSGSPSQQVAAAVSNLLDDLERAEAETQNAQHDYDARGERLWRLADLAGHEHWDAENDACAERTIADALRRAEKAEASETALREGLLHALRRNLEGLPFDAVEGATVRALLDAAPSPSDEPPIDWSEPETWPQAAIAVLNEQTGRAHEAGVRSGVADCRQSLRDEAQDRADEALMCQRCSVNLDIWAPPWCDSPGDHRRPAALAPSLDAPRQALFTLVLSCLPGEAEVGAIWTLVDSVIAAGWRPSPSLDAAKAEALREAADEVRRVREHGLAPGERSAPYHEGIENWLRERADALDAPASEPAQPEGGERRG